MKRKIIYALLSVVIAFGLWIYVITTVSPEWEETYYNIPVVLNNETVLHDNGLMLLEEQTPTVTLKLSGKRSDFALKHIFITEKLDSDISIINSHQQYNYSEKLFYAHHPRSRFG